MQVTAEHPDPCTVVLDISVDEQQVARAFETAYKEFGRYTNVPGFRPGKAPRAILERYVNQERVRQQALEKIVRDNYFKALEEEAITPYRDPRIEPTDLEDKKAYSFKAIVPLEPQVTLGDYTNLAVDKPVFKVTEEMLDQRLNALREERARLERIADRPAQEGDILIVEQQVAVEGDESEPGPPRRHLVQAGSNIPGYYEALMGLAIGEERQFDLTYPEDFEEEDKQGKKAAFTVKLTSISAKRMPELNDEFAKTLGAGETLDEMRESVRTGLQAEADQYSDQVAEQRIFNKILENSSVYFPEVLAQEEVEDSLRRLSQELRQNNMGYGQYLQNIGGLTPEQHQAALYQQAAQQIRTLLALREISIQEDLQATDEQVDEEFERLLNTGSISEDQYEEFRPDARRRLQVANALIQQRLHDFLFAHNTLNEVEQSTMPDPDATEEFGDETEVPALSGETENGADATAENDGNAPVEDSAGAEQAAAGEADADASQEPIIHVAETPTGEAKKTD